MEIQASAAAGEGNRLGGVYRLCSLQMLRFWLHAQFIVFSAPCFTRNELSVSARPSNRLKRAKLGGFLNRVPACGYDWEAFEGLREHWVRLRPALLWRRQPARALARGSTP